MINAQEKLTRILGGAAVACLALTAPANWSAAIAAPVFNGWNAGVSAASFNWSTDLFDPRLLGLPDIACVYPSVTATCADTRYPHGTTTPGDLAPFSLIAGQQVEARIERSGPMKAVLRMDVQPAGEIEGKVTHLHFENAVPFLSGFGLFTTGQAIGLLTFGGIGPTTPLYYHVEWSIDAGATGPGVLMDYSVAINGDDPSLRGTGLAPQDLSGSYSGSVIGASLLSPSFRFGLTTPAGISRATAAGTLDVWMTFSSEPVDRLPSDDPEVPVITDVPAPGTLLSLLLGAGMLATTRRRKTQA